MHADTTDQWPGSLRLLHADMPLKPCGSWLASDGGESVISSGKDIAPSRGKLAPTNAAYTLWELACQRWRCVSHFIRQGHCAIARQARSHKCRYHPVGAGLPAMAVGQSIHPAITLRHREASSLLQGVGGIQINRLPQMPLSPCGSWLASDGGESVLTSGNDIEPSRGKLAPTDAAPPRGSWLASDGGVSVISSGEDIAPSRGKLAPTNAAYTLWELACQRWR